MLDIISILVTVISISISISVSLYWIYKAKKHNKK